MPSAAKLNGGRSEKMILISDLLIGRSIVFHSYELKCLRNVPVLQEYGLSKLSNFYAYLNSCLALLLMTNGRIKIITWNPAKKLEVEIHV